MKSARRLLRLDTKTDDALRKIAYEERISISSIIRTAVEKYLQKRRTSKAKRG